MDVLYQIDASLLRWLNSWAGNNLFWDWAIIFRATYLWYVIVLAVAGFGSAAFLPRFRIARRRNLRLVVEAAAAALIARFGLTELTRFFYNRPRPFEGLPDIIQLIPHPSGGSFPSGHAALSFAVAAAVAFYYPKASILFFLAALSIGVGRVAAGLHWPSDIAGGAVIGVITAVALKYLAGRLVPPGWQ